MSVEVPQNPQLVPDGNLTVSPVSQKKNNFPLVLLSLLVLVLVGSGGFILAKYLYVPKAEVSTSSQPSATQTQSPFGSAISTPSANTPGISTDNWKTYSSKKYRFEVKYNPDLNPTESGGSSETTGQFTYLQKVSFGTNPIKSPYGYEVEISKKSLGDYRAEIVGHVTDKIDSEKEVTVNEILWTKIAYKTFLTTDYVSVTKAIVNHNGYGYTIASSTSDVDQILSTFKFL